MAQIAPSLFAADFACLARGLEVIEESGAKTLHLDVADGHFVPEITAGQPVVARLRQVTRLVLDVHLLVERPERYVSEFVRLGVDRVTVHAEATAQLHRVIRTIKAGGAEAGVALNPATGVGSIADILGELDAITLISPRHDKIQEARRLREESGGKFLVQAESDLCACGTCGADVQRVATVDERWEEYLGSGADILVVGPAIFSSDDPQATLEDLIRRAGA
jgi:ribulose-phosphate 3-epimerase